MYIRTYINIHTGVYRWYLRTGSPESGFNGKRERERERERKKKSMVRKTKRKNTRSPVVHFERNRRKKSNVYYKMLTRALNVDYILIFKQKSGSHSSNKPVFNESE